MRLVSLFLVIALIVAGLAGYGQPSLEYTSMVAAGGMATVGLKSDGTVNAVGWNDYGQCDVGNWTSIANVAVGFYHTVGVKSNRTVLAVGDNNRG